MQLIVQSAGVTDDIAESVSSPNSGLNGVTIITFFMLRHILRKREGKKFNVKIRRIYRREKSYKRRLPEFFPST